MSKLQSTGVSSSVLLAIVSTVFECWECFDGTEEDKVFTGLFNDLALAMWREELTVYHWMKLYSYWDTYQATEATDELRAKYNL